jgi:hypothetical protein
MHTEDHIDCGACQVRSAMASRIIEALDSNEHWFGPTQIPVPHNEDVRIGSLVFRYGSGPHRDRWYVITAEQADTGTDPIRAEIARLDAARES